MSQTVQTPFGTGTVVDRESVRGRVSYKVEGPGFSTWIEAAAMPVDFQWMPGPDDVQDNSVTLPYNPAPQTWRNPSDQNIVPGRQEVDPERRTHPADSVDFQEEAEEYVPGPAPHLFAGSLSPEDIQAKLGPKYVNAFVEHDFTSLQARIDENPDLVLSEYKERVAELVMAADSEYLERVGRNEYLEASDPAIREAAWKDVRAKAVRLRRSGQVNLQAANPDIIATQVTGDHGTYECLVVRSNIFQGNSAVDSWSCNCPWGQWAFKREHKFVGRLCSHAYASLLELQALMKSKAVNPRFRNTPGIMAERTASSLDHYWEFVEWAEDNDYDEFDRDSLSVFIQDKLLQGEAARSLIREWEESTKMASRTAEIVDLRPVGWDPYSRNLMNQLRDLWQEGERPGRQKERNEEIRELVDELRERGFATDGVIASFKDGFIDSPMGYDDIPDYGTSEDYVKFHELQRHEDVMEPEFEYTPGTDDGVVNDINDGGRNQVASLSLPKGTRVQRLNLDGSPSERAGVVYRDHQGLTEWDQVAVLWDGDDKPSLNDLTEVQWGEYEDGGRTSRRVTASGWSFDSNNGSLRFDDGTVRVSIGAGSSFSNSDHLAEGQWGAFVQSGASNQMVGAGRAGTVEDAYAAASAAVQSEGASLPPIDVDYHRVTADYQDYSGGDQYGGDEDPYYVDPAEREDWDDPLPDDASEDDIVANFQRNAAWLMGDNDSGSGGDGDIAAAAEAHLRTAGRSFTLAEQQALIDEDDGQVYDPSQLRLDGTHYL